MLFLLLRLFVVDQDRAAHIACCSHCPMFIMVSQQLQWRALEQDCAQPHSVMLASAETTETPTSMNQTRNKKPETIVNQRIISAERALFLPLSIGVVADDQLLSQSIKHAAASQ